MPLDILGRLLFPKLEPWERRRKIIMIASVLFVALACAGCVGIFIYKQGHKLH